MRVRFGGTWIADSENVLLPFEPVPLSGGLLCGDRRLFRHPTPHRANVPASRTSVSPSGTPSEWASRPHRAGRVRLARHGRLPRRRRTDPSEEFWRCASASSEDFSERVLSLCFQKTKEKMIWQQAKRETRNTGKGIS